MVKSVMPDVIVSSPHVNGRLRQEDCGKSKLSLHHTARTLSSELQLLSTAMHSPPSRRRQEP